MFNMMIAISDFTPWNGATVVIPRSHLAKSTGEMYTEFDDARTRPTGTSTNEGEERDDGPKEKKRPFDGGIKEKSSLRGRKRQAVAKARARQRRGARELLRNTIGKRGQIRKGIQGEEEGGKKDLDGEGEEERVRNEILKISPDAVSAVMPAVSLYSLSLSLHAVEKRLPFCLRSLINLSFHLLHPLY